MKLTVKKKQQLLEFLMENVGYSTKTKARQALKHGSVKVNGAEEKNGSREINTGDQIFLITEKEKKKINAEGEEFRFPILYEDHDLIVVDKPAGLLTVPDNNNKKRSLLLYIDKYIRKRSGQTQKAFPVQRLDRDYSGLVFFAKTFNAQQEFFKIWKDVKKRYYTVVEGIPEKKVQILNTPLKENRAGVVYADAKSRFSKPAETEVFLMNSKGNHSLLRVTPIIEFKGQIRAHLADAGFPVIGDKKYEAKTDPLNRLGIHLFSLEGTHPITGEKLEIKTPVPPQFLQLIKGRKIK